jgi:hypothetical protein
MCARPDVMFDHRFVGVDPWIWLDDSWRSAGGGRAYVEDGALDHRRSRRDRGAVQISAA